MAQCIVNLEISIHLLSNGEKCLFGNQLDALIHWLSKVSFSPVRVQFWGAHGARSMAAGLGSATGAAHTGVFGLGFAVVLFGIRAAGISPGHLESEIHPKFGLPTFEASS